jgi:Bacterial PH domain
VRGRGRRIGGTMGSVSTSGPLRAVFRVSPLVILFALALAVCATPVAFGAPYLWLVYLVPVAIIAWTLRTRTVVDADGLRVRRLVGGRHVPWDAVTALRLDDRSRVRAVLTGGEELALPTVRVRDLPVLATVSGGRVPDPSTDPE